MGSSGNCDIFFTLHVYQRFRWQIYDWICDYFGTGLHVTTWNTNVGLRCHWLRSNKILDEDTVPDVSMTIGIFLSRANLKTFSSRVAIPSGLICMDFSISTKLLWSRCALNAKTDSQNKIQISCSCNSFLLFWLLRQKQIGSQGRKMRWFYV